jgi:hypothetical protein
LLSLALLVFLLIIIPPSTYTTTECQTVLEAWKIVVIAFGTVIRETPAGFDVGIPGKARLIWDALGKCARVILECTNIF